MPKIALPKFEDLQDSCACPPVRLRSPRRAVQNTCLGLTHTHTHTHV